jgi:polar amino acid transport system substrate-binding protein
MFGAAGAGLLVALVCSAPAAAQSPPAPRTLVVGTKEAPPFAIKGADGSWSGISIELWRQVAEELGYTYELRESDLAGLLQGVSSGDFDVGVAALTITPDREASLDFTHPFHVSGLGIAARRGQGGTWIGVLRPFLSTAFLRVVLGLSGLLFLVALLVWLFERRLNAEQFGGSAWRGIGSGFWWSAVTMTTVGYGDKSPRSMGGRIVALVWMFTALIVISSFTAAITASLTITRLAGPVAGPDDLSRVRVGSVSASTSASYLDWRQLPYAAFPSAGEALQALADGQVDAVVYDAPILRYDVRQRFSSQLVVLPGTFERQYYGFAVPAGSPLREAVNRDLLARISTPAWQSMLQRYLGDTR